MRNICVIGATGLLGCELVNYLSEKGHLVTSVRNLDSSSCLSADCSRLQEVRNIFSGRTFDFVINLCGKTSVEECETDPHSAYLVNTKVVENLTQTIRDIFPKPYLIQISTDQVYDSPGYSTEDQVVIRNTYAMTKYSGEIAALTIPSTVLRVNFIGKSKVAGRESLTDWVFRSLSKGRRVEVLEDVYFNPLTISRLCGVIGALLSHPLAGVFNVGASSGLSKADFDYAFSKQLGLNTDLMSRITLKDAAFLKARRPEDMRMNVTKIEKALGIRLPSIHEIIAEAALEYKE